MNRQNYESRKKQTEKLVGIPRKKWNNPCVSTECQFTLCIYLVQWRKYKIAIYTRRQWKVCKAVERKKTEKRMWTLDIIDVSTIVTNKTKIHAMSTGCRRRGRQMHMRIVLSTVCIAECNRMEWREKVWRIKKQWNWRLAEEWIKEWYIRDARTHIFNGYSTQQSKGLALARRIEKKNRKSMQQFKCWHFPFAPNTGILYIAAEANTNDGTIFGRVSDERVWNSQMIMASE